MASSDQSSPVQVGDLLKGRYLIEKILGQGGMGVVVAAMDQEKEERVALKFMLGKAAASKEYTTRFLREAKAGASLKSEYVAKVLDLGLMDDGVPFMVLEHLNGTDLLNIIEANGPVPIDYACEYVMQAALGMAEAHARGIVHRDLKPANLFLTTTDDGQTLVKLIDFGIAKAAIDSLATKTSTVMGAPLYMPPEQMRSTKNVDARADIWALGATLYHLLTGALPFQAPTMTQLCVAILGEPPVPFEKSGVQIPEALQAVVLQCLEKELEDRPQSCVELVTLLAPFSVSNPAISTPEPAVHSSLADDDKPDQKALAAGYGDTTMSASSAEIPVAADSPGKAGRWLLLAGAAVVVAGLATRSWLSSAASSENGSRSESTRAAAPPSPIAIDAAVDARAITASAESPVPPVMAMLKVSTKPPRAKIIVNGEEVGDSPLAFEGEMRRTLKLRIERAGYHSIDTELLIEEAVHELKFVLKRKR
jgi:serine/threonine protein kinase